MKLKYNSFFEHLKKEGPHLILLKCICHTSAKVASKCSQKLPDQVETLVKNIARYFMEVHDDVLFFQKCKNYIQLTRRRYSNLVILGGYDSSVV